MSVERLSLAPTRTSKTRYGTSRIGKAEGIGGSTCRRVATLRGPWVFKEGARVVTGLLDCLQDVAQLCEDLEEWDDALDAYRRVLALDPERVQESCAIAEILRRSERYEEAIESYRATLAIDAGFVFALSGMGDALRMLERNNEALEWFEKALERKPTHVFAPAVKRQR